MTAKSTKTWALALMLVTFALAGCLGSDSPTKGSGPSTSTTPAPTGGSGGGGGGGNGGGDGNVSYLPPKAGLTSSLLNGTSPLSVMLYATNTGGPMRANASWTLRSHGPDGTTTGLANGTQLPAEVNTTLTIVGNHTVTLAIDKDNETISNASLVIVVEAPLFTDAAQVFEFTGSFVEDDDTDQSFIVDVLPGSVRLAAWLTWDDGLLGNSPALVDIDLTLKDPDGNEADTAESYDFEYLAFQPEGGLQGGAWTYVVTPYYVPVESSFKLSVIAWAKAPTTKVFEGEIVGGVVLGSLLGVPIPGTDTVLHTLDIPEGTGTVTARLVWNDAADSGTCTDEARVLADFDLYVTADSASQFQSGNAAGCEFGFKDAVDVPLAKAGKTWTFEVRPFSVSAASYTLTIQYA
jgi:hypothetical protein